VLANVKLIQSFNKGLVHKWDRVQVDTFCKLLVIEYDELAAYLNMKPWTFKNCLKDNKLPGPACVLLDLWENYYKHITLNEELKDYPSPVQHDRLRSSQEV